MKYIIPLVLDIPYYFTVVNLIIFLFLISIPFKFYLLKYYLGIIDIQGKFIL